MKQCKCCLFLVSFLALVLMGTSAFTFEILLDIDTDNDPATINISTEENSAVVKIVLWPTTPGEEIGYVTFGVGGECLPCPPIDGVQEYGISFDLPVMGESWVTAPGFDSEAGYATYLGCPGNPGYHEVLSFWPKSGGTIILNNPIFLAEFNAWVSPPVPEGCPQPAPILMAMPGQGEYYGYVGLAGAEGPYGTEESSWGRIKEFYR
jgi:hypothetical protein